MTDTGKTDSGKKVFRVIGMMSGTSADGVDAALIDTDGYNHVVPGPEHFRPYTMAERQSIKAAYAAARSMAPGDPWPQPLCEAAQIITDAHCQTVSQLLMQSGIGAQSIDLLGFHGQTVLHDPDRRFTLQIGLPDQLARQARIDVVFDFRTADVEREPG